MNIELAQKILKIMKKPEDMFVYIPDHNIRPGHDRRYALDCSKIGATGWKAKWNIEDGFRITVGWYVHNQWWFM